MAYRKDGILYPSKEWYEEHKKPKTTKPTTKKEAVKKVEKAFIPTTEAQRLAVERVKREFTPTTPTIPTLPEPPEGGDEGTFQLMI